MILKKNIDELFNAEELFSELDDIAAEEAISDVHEQEETGISFEDIENMLEKEFKVIINSRK